MFRGLSAFPLTPVGRDGVDDVAFARLIDRLVAAGVDSIGALGSTGSYMYLDRAERARIAALAVERAAGTPVIVGVGALRTEHVLEHVSDAQSAGADAVLLAPVSYQRLTDDDVYGLYEDVDRELSVPLVVYDNPGTTGFEFTDDLYGALGQLTSVAAIKLPGVPEGPGAAAQRVTELRRRVPSDVALGVSGDGHGAVGLLAGCESWFSVIGGALPAPALKITRAALSGDADAALATSELLRPVWDLMAEHGSLRVTAAIAEYLGLVEAPSLPRPIRGLGGADAARVAETVDRLGFAVQGA